MLRKPKLNHPRRGSAPQPLPGAASSVHLEALEPRALLATFIFCEVGGQPTPVTTGPYFVPKGGTLILDATPTFTECSPSLTFWWDLNRDGQFTQDEQGARKVLSWDQLVANYGAGVGGHDHSMQLTLQVQGYGAPVTHPVQVYFSRLEISLVGGSPAPVFDNTLQFKVRFTGDQSIDLEKLRQAAISVGPLTFSTGNWPASFVSATQSADGREVVATYQIMNPLGPIPDESVYTTYDVIFNSFPGDSNGLFDFTLPQSLVLKQGPIAPAPPKGVLHLRGSKKNDGFLVHGYKKLIGVRHNGKLRYYPSSKLKLILIETAGGNDSVYLFEVKTRVSVFGGQGDDTLQGADSPEALYGEDGNDSVVGMGGDDTLSGGAGDDALRGGTGRDRLIGGHGNDVFDALDRNEFFEVWRPERDFIHGGAGRDSLQSDDRDDRVLIEKLVKPTMPTFPWL